MRNGLVLATAAAVVSFGACSADNAAVPSFAVTDSAGVEVVTTTDPPWDADGSAWSLVLAVEIGELDGAEPYLFGDVADVALLPGGGFAVADAQTGDLRFFGDAGDFRGRAGRQGDGPGEFQSFSWMAECDGSLVAYDPRLRRVTTLSLTGELLDTRPFETPEPESPPYRSTCGPDGSLVAVGFGDHSAMWDEEGVHFYTPQPAELWVLGADSGAVTTIGTYISSERIARINSRGGGGSSPHPFGRSVVFAATDSTLLIGGAERLQVEVRGMDGTLERIFRGPDADLVIDDDFMARYEAANLTGRDSVMRADVVDSDDAMMPPRYPAYSELMVDDLGYIWVERFVLPWAEERRWGIFDPEGVFLGHVEVPLDFAATDVDATRLAGVATDEIGVPRVRVYDLVR